MWQQLHRKLLTIRIHHQQLSCMYAHANTLTLVVKLVLTTGTFGLGFFAGFTTCASLNSVSWSPA